MLLSPTSSNGGLPNQSFWGRFRPKSKEPDKPPPMPPMALTRQRLLTLAFGDMETICTLPGSYDELEAVARNWAKPPPDAVFTLRVPVEYASIHAARLVAGPYIYLTSEDSFQIAAMGAQGIRVEIVSDAPPPPDEPPPPPPPPVLEMPATFNLELAPGQHVALDTTINSDELDMARMEDGTTVDGIFWGKLDIVHQGDTHTMEFSGTRLANQPEYSPEFMFDSKVLTKLATAAKPTAAKCNLSILSPEQAVTNVILTFSPYWKLGTSWPPAELGPEENKLQYFIRINPGGALEHFESQMVTTALYYEAIPDAGMLEPDEVISPSNGFAMSTRDFIPHLMGVLDQLGMSLYAKTNFINNNISTFSAHKNIAYRFLRPSRIAAAVDITIESCPPCVFTRLFMLFRGLTDEEVGIFDGAGEKEANSYNWREVVGWTEESKDPQMFRVLETSVLEVT